MNIYVENGYKNRKDYLNCLAEDFGLNKQQVYMVASMLGEWEDFDGLISTLEDMEGEF
jgi:hypothetical protein